MSGTELVVRRAEPADMDAIYALRAQVFVGEQRVPLELERDEDDQRAVHVLARREGALLGTGRLVVDHRQGKIGRMAVAPEARGQGVGLRLMQCLTAEARALGLEALYLDAQLQALGFYQRQGYAAEGEVFMDAGIPHRRMRRALTTPARPPAR